MRSDAGRYYISYVWWVLGPVLETLVYYTLFAVGLRVARTEHFVPFLLIGIITWRWFATTCQRCSYSIIRARSLIQQVYLPKVLFPLITICTNTFQFLISFTLIVLYVNFHGLAASSSYVMLPVLLAIQLLVITAVGLCFAAITPFFPDFAVLVGYVIRLMFFISGIFFDIQKISEPYRQILLLNPMARLIQDYRIVLIQGSWPSPIPLVILTLCSIAVILLIGNVIHRLDRVYPRVLER